MASDAELKFPETADEAPRVEQVPQDTNNAADIGNLLKYYRTLHRAIKKGDWQAAKIFLDNDHNAKTADITGHGETVLHAAAWAGNAGFIKELLKELPDEAFVKQSVDGMTALHVAVAGGNLEIVEALVEKNPMLTQITQSSGHTPLVLAAFYAREEVVTYLCSHTKDEPPSYPFTGPCSGALTFRLTHSGYYDILVNLIKDYHSLAVAKNSAGESLLSVLATKPADFPSGSSLSLWERCIYHLVPAELNEELRDMAIGDEENPLEKISDDQKKRKLVACFAVLSRINNLFWSVLKHSVPKIKHIMEKKLKHKYIELLVHCACKEIYVQDELEVTGYFSKSEILYRAVESGIVEIVTICLHYFPNLMWIRMGSGYIFQVAIDQRREKIFNLVYEANATNKLLSDRSRFKETSLHLVAKLAPYPQLSSISCSALQMQRELQWFKAVENFIQPSERGLKNRRGQSASELFTSEHKELAKQAEQWMRDTSNSCMLVSTLIATVAFAAAFTVPGGIDSDKGIPIFLNHASFTVFAISTAFALFSSATSVLMFLSILTARYAEEDFLHALPERLILGLASLFIAIAAMMVAFGSALQIMLSARWKWFYIPTMVLGAVPVALFMMLQFPLFFQMVWSTFGPSIFRPKRIW